MKIEKAQESDLHEILSLQYLAYRSEAQLLNNMDIAPLKQTIEQIEQEFLSGIILKAMDEDGSIIGSVRAYSCDGTLYIGKLIVHPDFQGMGIGTKLLYELESISPHQRYELFTSTKSTRNIKLYKRLGYNIFREKDIDDNLKYVYLEKNS